MIKMKRLAMVFLFAVLHSACSSGGGATGENGSDGVGGVTDTTAPTISSTTPQENTATASVAGAISATFSEGLDASTITANTFTLDHGATGVVTYNSTNHRATFTPEHDLLYGTLYTATVTTGVKDTAGNALASAYAWSFTTVNAPAPPAPTAVTMARPGWTSTLLYSHPLGYPQNLVLDGKGDLISYSRGNQRFIKYDNTAGALSTLFDAGAYSNLYAVGYQPNAGRIIFIANGQLYELSNGTASPIGSPSLTLGLTFTIAVDPADDTFYGCGNQQNGSINKFSAAGALQATLATGVNGCFSLVYDASANTLFYSETFDGEINALELSNNQVSVLATGVGIPGTTEPIALALDAGGILYSFPAANGLFRYDGDTTWTKVVAPLAGAGPLLWYPKGNVFVTGNGVGANLTAYDPADGSATHLTQYVNATGIAELSDGSVLLCDWNFGPQLMMVTGSGLAPYGSPLPIDCNALEHDDSGTVYVGMNNGSIGTIIAGGNVTAWSAGGAALPIMRMAYDGKNARLLAVYGDHAASTAYLYGIPLAAPDSPALITTLTGITTGGAVPAVTVDSIGNIYLLERTANVIHKIMDGSTTRTTFASNVLDSAAITVPDIEYIASEDGLLVSTIEHYELWPLSTRTKSLFATNTGAVDNFAINQAADGSILATHSGQVFRMIYSAP